VRLVLVAAAVLLARPAAAQSLREFSATRQQRGEPRLAARIEYASGSLTVLPAAPGILYDFRVTYDEERFQPLAEFGAGGALRLGTEALGRGALHVGTAASLPQAATVALSTQADLDLTVRLGAAEARAELGGMRLGRLVLDAGASRATVRFTRPNLVRCGEAALEAGAAELTIIGLGNARCERVALRGGGGRVTLDFGGAWRGPMAVDASMKLGELVLRLPRTAGVRLTLDRFLTSFAPEGLASSDGGRTWSTARFEQAAARLDIAVETAIGGLKVEWID
jgi:hypothetical protein